MKYIGRAMIEELAAEYDKPLTHPCVILLLTLSPCFAFILFALDRRNYIALIPAICFTACHLIYGIVIL